MHKTPNIKGFTIVEMMVVVAVLGILISLTAFATRGWQQSIEQRQVKSDLGMASTALESAKNFGSGYPAALPASYNAGRGSDLAYVWGNSDQYCMQATSKKDNSIIYRIESESGLTPLEGACSPAVTAPILSSLSMSAYSLGSNRWQYNFQLTGTCETGTIQFMSDNILSTSTANPNPNWGGKTWQSPTSGSQYSGSITPVAGQFAPNNYMWFMVKARCTSGIQVVESASYSKGAISGTPPPLSAPTNTPTISYTGPTNVTVGSQQYSRFTIYGNSSVCTVGTLQWRIKEGSSSGPNWSGSDTYQSSNQKQIDVMRFSFGSTTAYIYAQPRCTDGTSSVEHPSYASGQVSAPSTGGSGGSKYCDPIACESTY